MERRQQHLWYDHAEEALRDVVSAVGGPKKVANMLWPDKDLSAGARYLNQCLDPERNEKLDISQILYLLRLGREVACHAAIHYLCEESGYEKPLPINPETERERVQREFIRAQEQMQELVRRMERLKGVA